MTPTRADSNTGYANGALSSHGAITHVDDGRRAVDAALALLETHPAGAGIIWEVVASVVDKLDVIGIPAFARVARHPAGGGAVPELAWYYCASAFELGITSSFDSMARRLRDGTSLPCWHCGRAFFSHAADGEKIDPNEHPELLGCRMRQDRFWEAHEKWPERVSGAVRAYGAGPGGEMHLASQHVSGAAPEGPGPVAIQAAQHQRRILDKLGRVPPTLRRVLGVAYSDRRCPTPLVTRYGLGLSLLVWRAQWRASESEPGAETFARLVDEVRMHWPTWEPLDDTEKLWRRTAAAADLLLWTAHARYGAHVLDEPVRYEAAEPRRRKARPKPEFRQAGTRGSAKRQLVQAVAA